MTLFEGHKFLDRMRLPWPEVQVPKLSDMVTGCWEVEIKNKPPLMRGYFKGLHQTDGGYLMVLNKDGVVWMSDAPMELESQQHILPSMRGHVCIAGGGLGITAYNAISNPKVTKVTLLEQDKDVIDFLNHVGGDWDGWWKLQILHRDALDLDNDLFAYNRPDFLWVDIWPTLGSDRTLIDVENIQYRVQAKKVAWWGMELDFMDWMKEETVDLPPVREDFKQWVESTGLPVLMVQDHWCWAARARANSHCF